MPLSDTKIRNLKAKEKKYKTADGSGLYIEVSPKGSKRWRFKSRYFGKEKLLSLGVYPEVKLKTAREKLAEMRALLANGIDPSAQRKAFRSEKIERLSNNFESVAREWHQKYSSTWVASHSTRILSRLERDLVPWLGPVPVAEVTPQQILKCVRRIENRGALESAHRALQNCGQILRYAVATGRAERDVTVDLKGALPPVKSKHFSAVTDPQSVGQLLRVIDSFNGTFIVQSALRLAPLVFVRPGELRTAKWDDIDLERGEWRYLVSKTKTEHIVPLSSQAVAILNDLYPLTNCSQYVFPSSRSMSRPMSDNAILGALRRMEISKDEMSGHGFRAMARTLLDEVLEFPPHLIEHQLAHAVKDPNGRAYNRTAHLPQRKVMMQAWADYLEKLKCGGALINLESRVKNAGYL
jgi:integrase